MKCRVPLEIVVWFYDTFDFDFGIYDLTKKLTLMLLLANLANTK